MIAEEKIRELVNSKLRDDLFLVDVRVSPANVIHVELDSMEGITIDQCVEFSRYIQDHLDRDAEDFELEVSSPGIDQYFKVRQQFRKNVGRELSLTSFLNEEYKGRLTDADDKKITLEVLVKEKSENSKKKETVRKTVLFDYDEIKKAKVIISFK